ncbi:hypothetical protein ACKKBG_A05600 [Auxenochlorella protothecoides x Auxenochlorella symbiontica]
MDEMRAMLDQLMGEDRNLGATEKAKYKPRKRHHTDKDVCKFYLSGFCPYEEFRRTKNDCGDCPGIHDDGCRAQYEAEDDRTKERLGYEAELLRWLEKLLTDLRKRIDSNTVRLRAVENPLLLHEDQAKLDAMTAQMKELVARAERLGEEGEVDGAMEATNEAEKLKAQRAALEAAAEARAGNNALKNLHQEVCPVSGLIINNDETRLRDHHQGRNFNAWKKLHEVHARLLEEQRARSERLRALRGAGPDEAPAKPRDWSHSSREREASNGARRRDRSWERGGRDERDRRYRDRSREARPLRHGDGRGPRDETGRRRREEGARDAGGRSRSRDRRPARDYDEGRGRDRRPVGSAQHGAAEEGEI